MKEFLGKTSFTWFVGIVEDRNDPDELGRVRVRCLGFHTSDNTKIPTESLPWAIPVNDYTSAAKGGVGISPTGIDVESWVFGFFADGLRAQEPMIVGTISGTDDLNPLAKGENTLPHTPDSEIGEPESKFAAEYPFNKVFQTESGHVKEYDDTPEAERIREYHKSGTFYEVSPDGTLVTHVVKDSYRVVAENDSLHVKGDVKIVVDGNVELTAKQDVTANINKTLTAEIKESATVTCPNSTVNGNVSINGNLSVSGTSTAADHLSGGISGKSHKHGGVQSGSSATSTPV